MKKVLDIDDYIRRLMHVGITPEKLISRITRCLFRLEDLFMTGAHRDVRNSIRLCLAHSRMLYDHGRMMSSAREYLLRKIESLQNWERNLSREISILRDGSSSNNEDCDFLTDGSECVKDFQQQPDETSLSELNCGAVLSSIDVSERNLSNLSEWISEKRKLVSELESRIEDASLQISGQDLTRSDRRISSLQSVQDPDPHSNLGFDKAGRSLCELRPRGGAPRMKTHIYKNDMSEEKELVSGEFGTSGRLGDAVPGVVRSSSSEGNPRMGAACVRGDDATAAVITKNIEDDSVNADAQEVEATIQRLEEDLPIGQKDEEIVVPRPVMGKRKALSSPEAEGEDHSEAARQPCKTRLVEQLSPSPLPELESEVTPCVQVVVSSDEEKSVLQSKSRSPSSDIGTRITRSAKKNRAKEETALKFDKLIASRRDKGCYSGASRKFESSIIDSDSDVDEARSIKSTRRDRNTGDIGALCNEYDRDVWNSEGSGPLDISCSAASDGSCIDTTHSKRGSIGACADGSSGRYRTKTKYSNRKDKTFRNPIAAPRGKKKIPEIVNRDKVNKEKEYSREDWLKMDASELGEVGLSYLAEVERQRYACGNLSGKVDGMIKDCNATASNIMEALVEKLTVTGDVLHLRTQNLKLKDELAASRRKAVSQEQEILELRRSIINLEKEVNALKEGFGPYIRQRESGSPPRNGARASPSKISVDHTEAKPLRPIPRNSPSLRLGKSPIPGCSTDVKYMCRQDENWPVGPDTMDWSENPASERDLSSESSRPSALKGSKTRIQVSNKVVSDSKVPKVLSRKDIKILENKVLVSPLLSRNPRDEVSVTRSGTDEWTIKKNRKSRASKNRAVTLNAPESDSSVAAPQLVKNINKTDKTKKASISRFKPKAIKAAVVTVTDKPGGATYAQILGKAKQGVSLASLGIRDLRMRRAMNGALVMELPGPDGKLLAGALRNTLQEVLGDDAAVNNPVASGELRMRGIDPATSQDDIVCALEGISGCASCDIKVSRIFTMRDGMGAAWVRCPLEYAIKIAEKGSVLLGWTSVRVELMKKKPIQCFRCWNFGHVRTNCKAEVDRIGMCFRCGQLGHSANVCTLTLNCAICAERKLDSKHRIGSLRCLQNQGYSYGVQNVRRVPRGTVGGTAQEGRLQS